MNQADLYPERIEELHAFLAARYGVRDRQATEVLLTALLPQTLTGWRRPWIIVETDWYNRDTTGAWFNLGQSRTDGDPDGQLSVMPVVRSMAAPRCVRTYEGEAMLAGWIEQRQADTPMVLVDAEWRRTMNEATAHVSTRHTMTSGRRHRMLFQYATLMAMCVRLRTEAPKTDRAARAIDDTADLTELRRLVGRIVDVRNRMSDHRQDREQRLLTQSLSAPRTYRPIDRLAGLPDHTLIDRLRAPAGLLYWCELLQRCAPLQSDWDGLIANLCAVARGVAVLYADGRPADWTAAERLMRDTIPYKTMWILEQAAVPRGDGRRIVEREAKKALATVGGATTTAEGREIASEIRRLNREAVLLVRANYGKHDVFVNHPWRYRLASGDYKDLIDRGKRILI